MANNMHKEAWIDQVMNSTRGMNRVQPPDGLYDKIMSKAEDAPMTRIIAIPVKRWAAAAILLLALNIGSVVYFTKHSDKAATSNTDAGLAGELQLGQTYSY